MERLSFLDELKIMLQVSSSEKLSIIVMILLIFLAYIFFTTNKKNAKMAKKIYVMIYTFFLTFTIIAYHTSLTKMLDYMMNNIFILIYFPNLAIYSVAIIAMNIILWNSIFHFKVPKIIKNINITIYCIMNYLLILILNIITTNKLDIFSQESIYSNKEVRAIIELSSTIFVIWVIFLILYKIIRTYQRKKEPIPVKKVVVERKVKVLPQNISEIKSPAYVKASLKEANKEITEPPLQQKSPQPLPKELDNLFSIEDYKILLNILKQYKQKEQQETDMKQEWKEEQVKYQQLQEFYGRGK